MISGNRARPFAALVSALLLWAAPAGAADGPALDRLMAALAAVPSSQARFVERNDVSLFTGPVESSGTLSYVRPDRLEKRTLQPQPESLRLEGDRLTITGPDGNSRTVAVSSMPEIQGSVEAIRATLSGDLPALRRYYTVGLEGDFDRWQLTLTPLTQVIGDLVRAIVISGERAAVGRIEIRHADGDLTTMTILPGSP